MTRKTRFVAVYLVLLAAAAYMSLHRESPAPLASPLNEFPSVIGQWRSVRQDTFSAAVLKVLRPSDYLSRRYVGPSGEAVDLYIGYHDGGQGSGPIHSPRNCLPGSGWFEVSTKPLDFNHGGKTVRLTQAVYRQGDHAEMFVYWFMVRSQILSDEIGLKLAEIASAVRYGQRGASFIRLNIPADGDPDQATARLKGFLEQAYPRICSYMGS